jgi:beta-galactosidase
MVILEGAQPLAYFDHSFFGKYPAITRNQFGQGTLTYEAAALTDKLQEKVLLDVLKLAGLTSTDQQLPTPVRVKHGNNRQGKVVHYYLNYSSDSQTFTYPYRPGTDLLSQIAVATSQALTLKPWDAVIVEEK